MDEHGLQVCNGPCVLQLNDYFTQTVAEHSTMVLLTWDSSGRLQAGTGNHCPCGLTYSEMKKGFVLQKLCFYFSLYKCQGSGQLNLELLQANYYCMTTDFYLFGTPCREQHGQ